MSITMFIETVFIKYGMVHAFLVFPTTKEFGTKTQIPLGKVYYILRLKLIHKYLQR